MQTIHVVTNYGAQGDGDADDSDALAAAVAAAYPGDTIVLPAGLTFRLTGTVTVDKRLRFEGDGSIVQTTNAQSFFVVTADGCEFDGLRFVGPSSTGHEGAMPESYGSGIVFKSVTGGSVRNCHFTSCPGTTPSGSGSTDTGAAVWLTSSSDCQVAGNTFVDCFMAINTDVFHGLPAGTGGHVITGNVIRGGTRGYVLDLAGTDTDVAGDVFSDNRISDTTGVGIDVIDADHGFALRGNTVTGCGSSGIGLARRCRQGQVIGNLSCYNTGAGLIVERVTADLESFDLAIVGNVFSDNTSHGIDIRGGYRLLINSNVIRDNGASGLSVAASTFPQAFKFVGNSVFRNQHHGLLLRSPFDWHIVGNQISLNGQAASGSYDGIHIDSASTEPRRVVMVANGFESEQTETQRYAINNTHSSGSHLYSMANTTTGQVTGEVSDTSGALRLTMTGTTGDSVILKSPDGTRYRLAVANGGALSTVAL